MRYSERFANLIINLKFRLDRTRLDTKTRHRAFTNETFQIFQNFPTTAFLSSEVTPHQRRLVSFFFPLRSYLAHALTTPPVVCPVVLSPLLPLLRLCLSSILAERNSSLALCLSTRATGSLQLVVVHVPPLRRRAVSRSRET